MICLRRLDSIPIGVFYLHVKGLIMKRQLVAIIYILLIATGCSGINKPSIFVYYKFEGIKNTDYSKVTIKIFHSKSQIEVDSAVCKILLLSLKDVQSYLVNYPVETEMWLPQDSVQSKNKLCLLVPPALENKAIMYPIAIKLIKASIPVAFLSYHGVEDDLMENHKVDYGLKEIDDGIIVLEGVKKLLSYDSLVAAIYGVSLGGVIALNIAAKYPNIKALVLEAMPYDLNKASKIAFGKSITELMPKVDIKEIENFQPWLLINKIHQNINILAFWSLSDKYINIDEIDSLIYLFKENKNEIEYYLINKKIHHFRYVHPLSKNEYDSLNNLIVDFIFKNLK